MTTCEVARRYVCVLWRGERWPTSCHGAGGMLRCRSSFFVQGLAFGVLGDGLCALRRVGTWVPFCPLKSSGAVTCVNWRAWGEVGEAHLRGALSGFATVWCCGREAGYPGRPRQGGESRPDSPRPHYCDSHRAGLVTAGHLLRVTLLQARGPADQLGDQTNCMAQKQNKIVHRHTSSKHPASASKHSCMRPHCTCLQAPAHPRERARKA